MAAHLGTAMIFFGLLLWLSFKARSEAAVEADRRSGAGPWAEALRRDGRGSAALRDRRRRLHGRDRERGVNEVGPNIAGAHLACGHQFPTCGDGKFLPFGNNRLTDIHLTHRASSCTQRRSRSSSCYPSPSRAARATACFCSPRCSCSPRSCSGMNVWLGEHAALIVGHLTVATAALGGRGLDRLPARLAPEPRSVGRTAPRAEASAAPA